MSSLGFGNVEKIGPWRGVTSLALRDYSLNSNQNFNTRFTMQMLAHFAVVLILERMTLRLAVVKKKKK